MTKKQIAMMTPMERELWSKLRDHQVNSLLRDIQHQKDMIQRIKGHITKWVEETLDRENKIEDLRGQLEDLTNRVREERS